MAHVVIVAGLGYGDEGKGSVIDALTLKHESKLVVRYNGGAQCGHNCVTPDGRHHTFSQFGSGTFHGASTHLSRFVLVNPISLLAEARHLEEIGIKRPLNLVTVEKKAPITTPFHVAANRLKEIFRGNGRHGSCGMGVGETMQDCLANKHLKIADLQDPLDLRRKLREIQQRKAAEFEIFRPVLPAAMQEWDILNDPDVVEQVAQRYEEFAWFVRSVDEEWLAQRLLRDGTILFEGAQGMLLDQNYGWHPYTTWTDITFKNAETLLDGLGCNVFRLGITRTHMTRHGAGPFVTEDEGLSFPDHNSTNPWQNNFRHGSMDFVALRYSIRMLGPVGDDPTAKGVDGIALTRMDDLPADKWRVCTKYCLRPSGMRVPVSETITDVKLPASGNWKNSEKITLALMQKDRGITPIYEDLDPKDAVEGVSRALGVPVAMTSHGPTSKDKIFLSPLRYP